MEAIIVSGVGVAVGYIGALWKFRTAQIEDDVAAEGVQMKLVEQIQEAMTVEKKLAEKKMRGVQLSQVEVRWCQSLNRVLENSTHHAHCNAAHGDAEKCTKRWCCSCFAGCVKTLRQYWHSEQVHKSLQWRKAMVERMPPPPFKPILDRAMQAPAQSAVPDPTHLKDFATKLNSLVDDVSDRDADKAEEATEAEKTRKAHVETELMKIQVQAAKEEVELVKVEEAEKTRRAREEAERVKAEEADKTRKANAETEFMKIEVQAAKEDAERVKVEEAEKTRRAETELMKIQEQASRAEAAKTRRAQEEAARQIEAVCRAQNNIARLRQEIDHVRQEMEANYTAMVAIDAQNSNCEFHNIDRGD